MPLYNYQRDRAVTVVFLLALLPQSFAYCQTSLSHNAHAHACVCMSVSIIAEVRESSLQS